MDGARRKRDLRSGRLFPSFPRRRSGPAACADDGESGAFGTLCAGLGGGGAVLRAACGAEEEGNGGYARARRHHLRAANNGASTERGGDARRTAAEDETARAPALLRCGTHPVGGESVAEPDRKVGRQGLMERRGDEGAGACGDNGRGSMEAGI